MILRAIFFLVIDRFDRIITNSNLIISLY